MLNDTFFSPTKPSSNNEGEAYSIRLCDCLHTTTLTVKTEEVNDLKVLNDKRL